MGDFEEAFKLKAQQLLGLLKTQNISEEGRKEVRELFDEATDTYTKGKVEDALVLVVQAIQRAKKG